jgi:hypothetical protein
MLLYDVHAHAPSGRREVFALNKEFNRRRPDPLMNRTISGFFILQETKCSQKGESK